MEKHIELNSVTNGDNDISEMGSAPADPVLELKRIDGKYIIDEISSVLNFDKGFFYTMRELLFRPGATIRLFLFHERKRLVKPIIFIILTSFIYSVLRELLHFEDGYLYVDGADRSTTTIMLEWIIDNYGYGNLIMDISIAFWIKIIFKKYSYNFYEILILLCYVMGMGMLILALFGTAESITNLKVLQFGGIVFFLYIVWAIGQFFDKTKLWNYGKALIAYMVGFIFFTIVVLLLGRGIDLLV